MLASYSKPLVSDSEWIEQATRMIMKCRFSGTSTAPELRRLPASSLSAVIRGKFSWLISTPLYAAIGLLDVKQV